MSDIATFDYLMEKNEFELYYKQYTSKKGNDWELSNKWKLTKKELHKVINIAVLYKMCAGFKEIECWDNVSTKVTGYNTNCFFTIIFPGDSIKGNFEAEIAAIPQINIETYPHSSGGQMYIIYLYKAH